MAEYSLHWHQLLRRGFGSNIHYELIAALLALQGKGACVRIAIDERRLRARDEHLEIFERDYWFGPSVGVDHLDDLSAVGEWVYGDPECGESILNPYWALAVGWTREGTTSRKVVQIEEFLPLTADHDGYVLVRYLHAIRDTTKRAFVHLDGAVKAYCRDSYATNLEAFRRRGKSRLYRKVFRVDGELEADDWSRLTALWFRGNQLALEYLDSLSPASLGQGH